MEYLEDMELYWNEKRSSLQTDLMIACKTEDIDAGRKILEWRDFYGKGVDISARDEDGKTALSLAKQSNNADIVALIEQHLFLRAVENGDIETVKTYLSIKESNFEVLYRRSDSVILMHTTRMRFKAEFETELTAKDSITRSVWLEAISIAENKCHDAHYNNFPIEEMLNLLLNDNRFMYGFNEDGQTILHQLVAEYLEADISSGKMKTLEILLKSGKFSANVSNLQNETVFEVVCKIKTNHCRRIDELLLIFLKNGIDLNGRNKNGETFLMLACKNKRIDIVRSLLDLTSRDFVLDIDAVDNSGETALMKAKENNDSKIVAALLGKKLISAVEDENPDAMLKDEHFLFRLKEYEPDTVYEAVAEYLRVKMAGKFRNMEAIEILLKSWIFIANILHLQNETICEIICKIKPGCNCQIGDLLQVLLQNGIDLNGRNKNGETFLMLACKNKRIDIVRSLLDLTSRDFVLNIDAVDNSGETALMKANEKNFYEIVDALLEFRFISAVKDENADIVKSTLLEFRNTLDIFVKSWSSNQDLDEILGERKTKSGIWLKTMRRAMENNTKHSEETVKLLLDCDILLSQEIETGYFYVVDLMIGSRSEVDDDRKLRLIELLLESGKFNVNDRDKYGRTTLNMAQKEKLISLLIRYGADVNKKDNTGRTPLISMSYKPRLGYGADVGRRDNTGQTPLMPMINSKERFPVFRTLLKEAGTLVNLDEMDCNGRTALMYAVMSPRLLAVELLLSAGASVNLSDNFGFTALHHALHGNINEHFKYPRSSEELKIMKEMKIPFDAQDRGDWVWRNDERTEERRKIVEMLLQRPDIDVNLLSIDKFSPLDIAEGQIPEIPSSIKEALKKKGAVLNVYQPAKSESKSDFLLDFIFKLTLTLKQLDKVDHSLNTTNLCYCKERWLALIDTFKEQIVSDKDQQGRTALHLAVMSFYGFGFGDLMLDFAQTTVSKLVSLGCSVNETDMFGRTPLHYAHSRLMDSLVFEGADASIKDKDGINAFDITFWQFSHKNFNIGNLFDEVITRPRVTYLLRLTNNRKMEISVQRVDDRIRKIWWEGMNYETIPGLLWEKGEYGHRHPLSQKITKEVTDLIKNIAKEIERLEPRFAIRPELVGSSNEGTKTKEPDEFDFCFVLTRISELCEVSQSPELPTGFVHLKRNPTKVEETSDFDGLFREDGILNTEKLNWQFAITLHNAVENIDSQLSLEWILKSPIKYSLNSDNINKVFNIQMIAGKPLDFFTVKEISVDIVPCIHVDGWWPDDAISKVSDEIRKTGCIFVFDSPRNLYPWVPYSESCARISFCKAESDTIKQSCDKAREAYMIGKKMAEQSLHEKCSKYVMKNSLLYCIESLSPSSEKAAQLGLSLEEMNSKFLQMDRYVWLKCLMKCHLEFVAQDFCPCYFLPNFSNCSVIAPQHYLKKVFLEWISGHKSTSSRPSQSFSKTCKDACAFYRCTSNDISESSYQLPAPDPLWERFDRKQLIASLCEIAYK